MEFRRDLIEDASAGLRTGFDGGGEVGVEFLEGGDGFGFEGDADHVIVLLVLVLSLYLLRSLFFLFPCLRVGWLGGWVDDVCVVWC